MGFYRLGTWANLGQSNFMTASVALGKKKCQKAAAASSALISTTEGGKHSFACRWGQSGFHPMVFGPEQPQMCILSQAKESESGKVEV